MLDIIVLNQSKKKKILNNMEFELARDILTTLNPNLKYNDFDVLEKLEGQYDLIGVTDFELFILKEDLDQIISRMICDWLPYRIIADKNFEITEVARYDRASNKIIVLSDNFNGGYYITEQVNKMNELLNHGESKV